MTAQILRFNCDIIDAVKDIVPSVKVQAAYYEILGADGMKCFLDTMQYAKDAGLIVIADVKRNDIGSTSQGVFRGVHTKKRGRLYHGQRVLWYRTGFSRLLMTAVIRAKVFLYLSKRRIRRAASFRILMSAGQKLYQTVADKVSARGVKPSLATAAYSSVGAVVGATYPEEAAQLRSRMKQTLFSGAGIRWHRVRGQTISPLILMRVAWARLSTSSRGILLAYRKEKFSGMTASEAARQAVLEMKQDILSALLRRGIDI